MYYMKSSCLLLAATARLALANPVAAPLDTVPGGTIQKGSNANDGNQDNCDMDACLNALKTNAQVVGAAATCAASEAYAGNWPGALQCVAGTNVQDIDISGIGACIGCSYVGTCTLDPTAEAHACGTGTDAAAASKAVILPNYCINLIAGRGLVIPSDWNGSGGYQYRLNCGNKPNVINAQGKLCSFPCYNCPQRQDIIKQGDYTDSELSIAHCK